MLTVFLQSAEIVILEQYLEMYDRDEINRVDSSMYLLEYTLMLLKETF